MPKVQVYKLAPALLGIFLSVFAGISSEAMAASEASACCASKTLIAPDRRTHDTSAYLQGEIQRRADEFTKDPNKLYQFVNESVLPLFDFQYIAQLVLGKAWRDATPDQRQRFTEAFKNMLVRTYAHALLEYRNEKIVWDPLQAAPGATDVTVDSKVVRAEGPPVPMSYHLHLKDNDWRIYDVAIDAVSLVTNYRGSFSSEVRKNGLDALIVRLESKQADKATTANAGN